LISSYQGIQRLTWNSDGGTLNASACSLQRVHVAANLGEPYLCEVLGRLP
jgi:hypothetical protein